MNGPDRMQWLHWIAGMALAALVAYFTTTSAIQAEIAALKATEESHFAELLRRLDMMTIDIRELRAGKK